ncbi:hypothetical protein TNCV_3088541 [Trichonephila clavipes]|uniref:Reverse transcriptase domain-containing protein n=1 Tax=Trichonephila clavipes TaxID=2585209 RepID=A0A8X6RHB6_TRICX|nr:hypothetical protein TNCV_3088541 [Trichonephila clavipes]
MPRASTKVFKKRRGVFNKGRCNKSNDGCGESNSTVPKNSADEKNCADGAKLCTNETEPSASKGVESARMFCGIMNLPRHPQNSQITTTFYCRQLEKPVNTVWQKLFVKQLMKMMEKGTLLLLLMVAGRSVVFLRRMAWLSQGLPQGSVLIPTLFTLLMYGIEEVISRRCESIFFVDDIVIWKSGADISILENNVKNTVVDA